MSNRKLAAIHWTIWINMILWLMAFGAVMAPLSPEHAGYPKYIIGGGLLFSAFVQHWAYYRLRKWLQAKSTPANPTG